MNHKFTRICNKKNVDLVKCLFFVFLENHTCLAFPYPFFKAYKEYVHVKHESHLLLSWALSYAWQFYAMHNLQWIYDLTFVSNAKFEK